METEIIEHTDNRPKKSLFQLLMGDKWIGTFYLILIAISALEMFSASAILVYRTGAVPSEHAYSHMQHLIEGLIVLIFAQRMSYQAIKQWSTLIFGFGVMAMIGILLMGSAHQGAIRSTGFLQPVEFCKLGTVLIIARMLTAPDKEFLKFGFIRDTRLLKKHLSLTRYIILLIVLGIGMLPVASQNMSSGIIITLTVFAMFFLAKIKGKYLAWTIGIGTVLAIIAGIYLHSVYQDNVANGKTGDEITGLGRIPTWANRLYDHPDCERWEYDMHGKHSQEVFSSMAVANSYPLGRFLGNSRIRDFLPEAYSDYIFAIIFEEWAFWGASIVFLLYLGILLRAYWLSKQTEDMLIKLFFVGLSLLIMIQALIHIGVSTGSMFVTGQPLPLISRGGTSIICTSLNIGIMLGLAKIIRNDNPQQLAQ